MFHITDYWILFYRRMDMVTDNFGYMAKFYLI